MDKRGISEIISWVLLVGITVTISVIVSVWISSTTEEVIKGTIEREDYICDDISLNARNETECTTTTQISITNTGSFTIHDFIIRSNNLVVRNGLNIPDGVAKLTVEPGQTITTQDLNIGNAINKEIELMPIRNGKTCSSRSIKIKC